MTELWNALAEFASNLGLVLALIMLAAVALLVGAFVLWRQTGDTKKPALMVVLAGVAIMNVLIWTVPTANGSAPIELLDKAGSP